MFNPKERAEGLFEGPESLEKGQIAELTLKDFRTYAEVIGARKGWLTVKALVWRPYEFGEKLKWEISCFPTDLINAFSLISEDDTKRVPELIDRFGRYLGEYITLRLEQDTYAGKVVKTYRDALTLSPFLASEVKGYRISDASKHLTFGANISRIEIEEISEDSFKKLPDDLNERRKKDEEKGERK